jgi:hypothetical protein
MTAPRSKIPPPEEGRREGIYIQKEAASDVGSGL